MQNSRIAILIPYFGTWPEWIELFFHSASLNSDFHFIVYTNCKTTFELPSNVTIHSIEFENYIAFVQKELDFEVNIQNPYKTCDLRPLFGHIHKNDFLQYDFYGWCDVDLIFGNLSHFYTKEILENYDVFSTHGHCISGHFSFFRNNEKNREMYKKIYDFKGALRNPEFVGIDEHGITNAYKLGLIDKFNEKFKTSLLKKLAHKIQNKKLSKIYLNEEYTTPFVDKPWIDGTLNSEQPNTWFWEKGEVNNQRDGGKNFPYIHFMNFRSSKWRKNSTEAPWKNLSQIVSANLEEMKCFGLQIDENGITCLNNLK